MPKIQKENRKFVLSVGDEGAILTCFDKRNLVKRVFVNAPSSSEYLELLSAAPNAPVYVLVDVVDQAYLRHTLPPVSSMNVNKLVSRKIAKDFDDMDIKAAIPLGREKTGRKEWHFLFVSVRNIPPFSDWIDAITNLPNPFGGIYLVPLESVQYLKDLQRIAATEKGLRPSTWQVLVSHNRVGGFRQVVFRDSKIIFTRIAQPIGGQTPDVVAGNIEQETLNTIEYIRRLGYDDSDGLDVYIIASGDVKNVLELGNLPATNRIVLTPHEISQKLMFENTAEEKDRFGDVVAAAHFVNAKKHSLRLNTPYTKKLAGLAVACKLIKTGGIVAALGMLAFAGYNFMQQSALKSDIESLKKKQAAQRQQWEAGKAAWQKFSEKPEVILTMSKLDGNLSADMLLPLEFIERYSAHADESFLARSMALSATKTENATSLDVKIIVTAPQVGDLTVDAMIDKIEAFKRSLTSHLPDYLLTFSNPLKDSINITAAEAITGESSEMSMEIGVSGPVKNASGQEKKNQDSGRLQR